ncbi:MAG: TonB-dependent receptor [Spirochaetia bacterium]|nr:TonB-dependent receptor [Spirochaetia bacterium]
MRGTLFALAMLCNLAPLFAQESVTLGAPLPFRIPANGVTESSMRAEIQNSLERAGLSVTNSNETRPDKTSGFFLGIYYSRSRLGNLDLYGQIYDGSTGYVVDAVSLTDEYLAEANLALPADEMKRDDSERIRQFADRMASRVAGNPRKTERTENIQESILALPIGKEVEFPVQRRAITGDVFRVLEDQKVVTATRQATRIKDAPAAVYVVTDQQIRERGYRTIVDALHDIPGFDIIHIYGIFPELIHQRGLVGNNQRTLVYIDGILDNNLTEQAVLGGTLRFPLYNVERIEVIGGPASALYGANAFNGVINIITKSGTTNPGGGIQALGGWHEDNFHNPGGAVNIAARGALKTEDTVFEYSASAYYLRSAGPNFGDIHQLDKKGFDPNDALYALEKDFCGGPCKPDGTSVGSWWSPYYNSPEDTYNITARFALGNFRFETINWQYLQGNGTFSNGTQQIDTDRIPGFTGASWDFRNNSASMGYLLPISSKLGLDSEITVRHTDVLSSSHDEAPNTPGPDAYYRPYDVTRAVTYGRPDFSYTLHEKLNWEQTRKANLTTGIESTYTVVPASYGSEKRFRYVNNALYLQQILAPWSWLSLTAGYRYDYSTIYGAANTPRLGAVFTPIQDLSIKLLASSGFRAPTAWELFNATNQRKANPDLRPEQLRSYEIGVGYRFFKKYYVSVQQYYNKLSNLLLEVQTAEPNPNLAGANWNQNQNVGKATIYGTEVQADLQIFKTLSVFLNYTFNRGRYESLSSSLTTSPSTAGRLGDDPAFDLYAAIYKQYLGRTIVPASGPIPNIAPNHANAGLTWNVIRTLSIYAGVNYVDIRRTVASNPVKTVKGYTMGTLNIRWEDAFITGLHFDCLVKNAANEQFFDPGIRTATGSYYPTMHPLEKRSIWLSAGMKF